MLIVVVGIYLAPAALGVLGNLVGLVGVGSTDIDESGILLKICASSGVARPYKPTRYCLLSCSILLANYLNFLGNLLTHQT